MRKLLALTMVIVFASLGTARAQAGPLENLILQENASPQGETKNCCWREILMDITVGADGSGSLDTEAERIN